MRRRSGIVVGMRHLILALLLLGSCTAPPLLLSATVQHSYSFDDGDPADPDQTDDLADAGHAAYNAVGPFRPCNFPSSPHSTSSGHVVASAIDGHRCPAHGVVMFDDAMENGATGTAWVAIRDELLRGQSWVPNEGDEDAAVIRRHIRMLAELAVVEAGYAEPDYEGIPDLGDLVVIVQIPALLPGNLTHVLGLEGRVQPPQVPPLIMPPPWEGALTAMVDVP